MLQEKPAVIDRRYSGKASLRAIEFVSELRTQDIHLPTLPFNIRRYGSTFTKPNM